MLLRRVLIEFSSMPLSYLSSLCRPLAIGSNQEIRGFFGVLSTSHFDLADDPHDPVNANCAEGKASTLVAFLG